MTSNAGPLQAYEEYQKWYKTINLHTIQFYDDDYCDLGIKGSPVKNYPIKLMVKYHGTGPDLECKWGSGFELDESHVRILDNNPGVIDSVIITKACRSGGYPIVKDMISGWKWVYLIKP
jgi:hypothetical protein